STSVRIRPAAAPSPAIEGDNSISRLDKARNVVLPAVGVACVRMQQYDRHAVTAAVCVPQTYAGKVRVSCESWVKSLGGGCHKQEQQSRVCVQAHERRSAEGDNHQVRSIHRTSPKV